MSENQSPYHSLREREARIEVALTAQSCKTRNEFRMRKARRQI